MSGGLALGVVAGVAVVAVAFAVVLVARDVIRARARYHRPGTHRREGGKP